MKKPWWIALPLAWAGVVVLVAALAWWVIDGAGESILAEPVHDAVSPGPTAAPATTETSAPRPSRTPRPTADPTSGSTAADPTTQPPASSVPPATEPPPTPPPTQQPDPVERTSTWQGEAGLLRVSCTGATLRLDGASPHDGYVVDKAEREDGREIEVKFRSTDGEREVEIHVVCVNGAPDFAVEQSGSDD